MLCGPAHLMNPVYFLALWVPHWSEEIDDEESEIRVSHYPVTLKETRHWWRKQFIDERRTHQLRPNNSRWGGSFRGSVVFHAHLVSSLPRKLLTFLAIYLIRISSSIRKHNKSAVHGSNRASAAGKRKVRVNKKGNLVYSIRLGVPFQLTYNESFVPFSSHF